MRILRCQFTQNTVSEALIRRLLQLLTSFMPCCILSRGVKSRLWHSRPKIYKDFSPGMEEPCAPGSPNQSEAHSGSLVSLQLPLIRPVLNQTCRTTNFFINDILRPDFGCRKNPGAGAWFEPNDSGRRWRDRPAIRETPRPDSSCTSSTVSSSASQAASSTDKSSAFTTLNPKPNPNSNPNRAAESAQNSEVRSAKSGAFLWPAWVYCTRYSDRPSSGKFLCFKK